MEEKKQQGGFREGAGRKPGKPNRVTVEKNKIQQGIEQIILKKANKLINAQMKLALGASYLFKKITDPETKKEISTMVTDPVEMNSYLNGDFEEVEDIVYYNIITTKPNSPSIEYLLDRIFGKPKQSTELSGELNVNKYEDLTDDELKERIGEYFKELGKNKG